jgi:hypothetical protein
VDRSLPSLAGNDVSDTTKPTCVEPSDAFVAWIDITGAGSLLRRSLPALASAVGVLNELCARAHSPGLELHPAPPQYF